MHPSAPLLCPYVPKFDFEAHGHSSDRGTHDVRVAYMYTDRVRERYREGKRRHVT